MRALRPAARRPAGVAVIVLLMLIPLLAMVAFAVDLGYAWRTDAELQAAADAAALAGAAQMYVTEAAGNHARTTPAARAALVAQTQAAVAAEAVRFGEMHRAGDKDVAMNAADVQVGYVQDPSANPTSTAARFQTGSGAPFPNSVRVTVRRDASVSTGPVQLFFAPALGVLSSDRSASATATLRSQGVTGFKGLGNQLLPLAIDQETCDALTGLRTATQGITTQDNYTVKPPNLVSGLLGLLSALLPPNNVSAGADGVPEVKIFINQAASGNCGLVALNGSGSAKMSDFRNWIANGASAADLASCGPNGLQATPSSPATLSGSPGRKASLQTNLAGCIGQPRELLVYSNCIGGGANATYQVIGFVGVTIVAVDLLNPINPSITVQLMPVVDISVTIGPVAGTGVTTFVHKGISLSR